MSKFAVPIGKLVSFMIGHNKVSLYKFHDELIAWAKLKLFNECGRKLPKLNTVTEAQIICEAFKSVTTIKKFIEWNSTPR